MSFVAVAAAAVVAGGAIAAASMSSSAAKKSAKTQAASADEAIAFQREQWLQQREDIGPWREAGVRGLGQLERLARQGPPRFDPFTAPEALDPSQFAFTPPTAEDLARDPSYQFRLAEGQKALERGAASRGGLLSGGALRGLERYAQDYASTEYGNVYSREMGENQLRYGRALTQNEAQMQRAMEQYRMRYNVGMGQWAAEISPWQTLAGFGQTSAHQLGQLGGQYASNVGELLTGQGAALAAGQMGSANAWAQGLGSLSGIAQQGLANAYLGRQLQPASAPTSGYIPNSVPYDPWETMGGSAYGA